MLIVESVEQEAKCILSGLQATSDMAITIINYWLTSIMVSFPGFKCFPVLHNVRLFLFWLIGCILKRFLCFFSSVLCITIATHLACLESTLNS